MLDLNKSDDELRRDLLDAQPAPSINWLAPAICLILTLVIERVWRFPSISSGEIFGLVLKMFLVMWIAIMSAWAHVDVNGRFKNQWGVVFFLGWVFAEVLTTWLAVSF